MRCQTCKWVNAEDDLSVRPPPLTEDDFSHQTSICARCGAVSIQNYNQTSGFGSVWLLEAGASVLVYTDPVPNQVVRFVMSEDYENNRLIADQLFTTFVQSLLNQNAIIQLLFREIGQDYDTSLKACHRVLTFLNAARAAPNFQRPPFDPLFLFLDGEMPPATHGIYDNSLRLVALDILEAFSDPSFGRVVDNRTFSQVQDVIDHMSMLKKADLRLKQAMTRMEAEQLILEGDFLRHLFKRRKARLSNALADTVWNAASFAKNQTLMGNFGQAGDLAFRQLLALLEHQLLAYGLLKVSAGNDAFVFQNPRDGAEIRIIVPTPRIEYRDRDRSQPKILADWSALLTRIEMRKT